MAVIKEDKQYFSIVTDIGNAAFANAAMTGTKVNITQFAVGDGNGNPVTPDPAMIGLVHEVWRGKIASAEVDSESPNIINLTAVIPSNIGSFVVREMAAITDDEKTIVIANCPDSNKVSSDSGASYEMMVGMQIILDNTETLEVIVDPTIIIASKEDVRKLEEKVNGQIDEVKQDLEEHLEDAEAHLKEGDRENWDTAAQTAEENSQAIQELQQSQSTQGTDLTEVKSRAIIAASATGSGAEITLELPDTPKAGSLITFKAPAAAAEGVQIKVGETAYPVLDLSGEPVKAEAWAAGSTVTLVLGDTNAFLQGGKGGSTAHIKSVILRTQSWALDETTQLYKQMITIPELEADHKVDFDISPLLLASLEADITPVNQNGTLYAYTSEAPASDLSVQATLTKVEVVS